MDNVPWHEEVIEFSEKLLEKMTGNEATGNEATGSYAIACEHEHSNCLLLVTTDFKMDESISPKLSLDTKHNALN